MKPIAESVNRTTSLSLSRTVQVLRPLRIPIRWVRPLRNSSFASLLRILITATRKRNGADVNGRELIDPHWVENLGINSRGETQNGGCQIDCITGWYLHNPPRPTGSELLNSAGFCAALIQRD